MTAPRHRFQSLGAGVQSSTALLPACQGRIPTFDAAIRHGSAKANTDGHALRGTFYLHASRVPLGQPVLRPRAAVDQSGCGPWSCPHAAEVTDEKILAPTDTMREVA